MARQRLLTGIEDVQRVFRTLPKENLERITHALNLGAQEIAARARILAPIDPNTSIDLKDQIEVRIATRTNFRRGGSFGPNSVAAYVVAGDTPERRQVAFRQEFGRDPGGAGVNRGHPGHRAQPFMFPAFHSVRRRVIGRVRRAVSAAARAVAIRSRAGG